MTSVRLSRVLAVNYGQMAIIPVIYSGLNTDRSNSRLMTSKTAEMSFARATHLPLISSRAAPIMTSFICLLFKSPL